MTATQPQGAPAPREPVCRFNQCGKVRINEVHHDFFVKRGDSTERDHPTLHWFDEERRTGPAERRTHEEQMNPLRPNHFFVRWKNFWDADYARVNLRTGPRDRRQPQAANLCTCGHEQRLHGTTGRWRFGCTADKCGCEFFVCALPGKEGAQAEMIAEYDREPESGVEAGTSSTPAASQPECKSRNGRWFVVRDIGDEGEEYLHHDGSWHGYCGENGFWIGREEAEGAMKAPAAPPLVTAEQAERWKQEQGEGHYGSWQLAEVLGFASSLLAQQQARPPEYLTEQIEAQRKSINFLSEQNAALLQNRQDECDIGNKEYERRRVAEADAADLRGLLWEAAVRIQSEARNTHVIHHRNATFEQCESCKKAREFVERIQQALAKEKS